MKRLMVLMLLVLIASMGNAAETLQVQTDYARISVQVKDCYSTATYALQLYDGTTTVTTAAVAPVDGIATLVKARLALDDQAYRLRYIEYDGDDGVAHDIGVYHTKEILRGIDQEFVSAVLAQLQIMPVSHRPIFLDALRNVVAGWMRNKQLAAIASREDDLIEY